MVIFQVDLSQRYQNVSILDFIGVKDDLGGGDNWTYKTCKAPNRHQQQRVSE